MFKRVIITDIDPTDNRLVESVHYFDFDSYKQASETILYDLLFRHHSHCTVTIENVI